MFINTIYTYLNHHYMLYVTISHNHVQKLQVKNINLQEIFMGHHLKAPLSFRDHISLPGQTASCPGHLWQFCRPLCPAGAWPRPRGPWSSQRGGRSSRICLACWCRRVVQDPADIRRCWGDRSGWLCEARCTGYNHRQYFLLEKWITKKHVMRDPGFKCDGLRARRGWLKKCYPADIDLSLLEV